MSLYCIFCPKNTYHQQENPFGLHYAVHSKNGSTKVGQSSEQPNPSASEDGVIATFVDHGVNFTLIRQEEDAHGRQSYTQTLEENKTEVPLYQQWSLKTVSSPNHVALRNYGYLPFFKSA